MIIYFAKSLSQNYLKNKVYYSIPNVSKFIKVQPKHTLLVILLQLEISNNMQLHTTPYPYKISLFEDLDKTGREIIYKREQSFF